MLDRMSRDWWIIALQGVAAVVFGVLALVWPGITLLALVFLFAAYALVDGVLALIRGLRRGGGGPGRQHHREPGRHPGEPVVVGQERVEADGEQEHLERQQDDDEETQRGRDLPMCSRPAGAGPVSWELLEWDSFRRAHGVAASVAPSLSPRAASAHTVPSRTSTSMRPSGRGGGPATTSPVAASKWPSWQGHFRWPAGAS